MVTHELSIDAERQVVIKRYVGNASGEAAREWRALRLLAEHAPRLAPEPISADLAACPPSIVMSLLPGEPLGGRLLTPPQERALAVALGQLWQAVPVRLVPPLPGERDHRAEFVRLVRSWAAVATAGPVPAGQGLAGPVREALGRGRAWLAEAAGLADVSRTQPVRLAVFGQNDGNLANFLWDGELVRIVDFEDSGVSDRAFELAVLVEHVSAWRDSGLEADGFTDSFDLSAGERVGLADWRRLVALYWLLRFSRAGADRHPGNRSSDDPGGVQLRRQAERLLSVL